MDKLKVAVICHVSNAEIRQNLDLESWTLKRLIKKNTWQKVYNK